LDDGRGLGEAAVEQDVPFRRCDQVAGDLARADVVDVANDAERLDRIVLPRRGGRVLGKERGAGEDNEEEELFHVVLGIISVSYQPTPSGVGKTRENNRL